MNHFGKIIFIKSAFLNFVLLVGTFWHLCEMSKFCIVHNEPVLIPLVCIKEWTGMVLKEIEQLVSGLVQEVKSMSAVRISVVRLVEQREIQLDF